jgi:hypothetical protein
VSSSRHLRTVARHHRGELAPPFVGGEDYTYLSKIVAPDFQLFQDCFPTDNGSVPFVVNNSSSLLQFVKDSRAGFEKSGFLDDLHFGEDNLLTLR